MNAETKGTYMNRFLLIITASLSLSGWAQAALSGSESVEIERSRIEEKLTIQLNDKTVRCLQGDYSANSLKISVPELRPLTHFRQTTRGETEPCINAGYCAPLGNLAPAMILNSSKPQEEVSVTIVLKEVLNLDHDEKTCSRQLIETIDAPVRGLNFAHQDGVWLGDTDYEACLKLKAAANK
jgi:hypothetical protein